MFFTSVDLSRKLESEKALNAKAAQKLVDEANKLLSLNAENDQRMMSHALEPGLWNAYDRSKLDPNHIFSIHEIRKICIDYRLRFLDFKHFSGDVPYEAISRMKFLEKKLKLPLNGLKIIAPSSLFQLADKDSDPLLMLNLGNDEYYLIHKWGKDVAWYRKWINYPFRSLFHFISVMVVAAMLVAQVVPVSSFPDVDSDGIFSIHRWYIFSFTLICFCSMSVFLLFTFRKNFSDQEWKNMYI